MPVDLATKVINVSEKTSYNLESDKNSLNNFISNVKSLMSNSKKQMILADFEVNRYNLNKELQEFVEASNLPVSSLAMGKGVIDETHPNFVGVYSGSLSNENITNLVKSCDLAFLIGIKLTDSITAGFSYINKNITLIEVHPLYCRIGENFFSNILMKDALESLKNLNIEFSKNDTPHVSLINNFEAINTPLTQKDFSKELKVS